MGNTTATADQEPLRRLRAVGIVPVVQLPDVDLAGPLADILIRAGLPSIEVTFRGAEADPVAAIAAIRAAHRGMLIAAGTVLTIAQAEAALAAGADLIVSPGTNVRLVTHVRDRGAVIIPGVASPSEIQTNFELGIHVLKFFPAELFGGPAFLRAVHAPFPTASFIPTGGVNIENLAAYLLLPNVVATWIAPFSALREGNLEEVGRRARDAAAAAQRARAQGGSTHSAGPTIEA